MIEAPKQPDPFLTKEQGEKLLDAIQKGGPPEDSSEEFLFGYREAQDWTIAVITMAAGLC